MEIQKHEGENLPIEAASDSNDGLGQPFFEYIGGMYVRPCARGTVLTSHPDEMGIEDLLQEGDYHVEIRVWRDPA